jgi:ribosomal protein S18 acetylase RimI-like enzyme
LNDFLSTVHVRLADEKDLPALEWDGEYLHFRRLYAEIYTNVRKGLGMMWVAELLNGGIIGQAFVSLNGGRSELSDGNRRAYVYGFRVKTQYRKQGVGSLIMKVIENDLKERGFRTITLNAGKQNIDALRLYKRLGYHIVGAEPGSWSYIDHLGKKQSVYEPAWRMEKRLREDNK